MVSDHGLNWNNCVLSEQGVVMALSLGRFVKERYAASLNLPAEYSPIAVTSQSTDFERTIRTGVGMLRGMYNGTNEIPFLTHLQPDTDDLLGYYYSWPSAVLGSQYIQGYNTLYNNATLEYFNQSNLDIVGSELGVRNSAARTRPFARCSAKMFPPAG